MNVTTIEKNGVLYIALDGEIDEHSVKTVRLNTDKTIEKHTACVCVVFDLQKVSFMDSTGIGFLIGRYKKIKSLGMNAYITSPNASADKILLMSGVYTLIPKINGYQAGGVQ